MRVSHGWFAGKSGRNNAGRAREPEDHMKGDEGMTRRIGLQLLLCISVFLMAAVAPTLAANLLVNGDFDSAPDAPCVGGENGATGTSYEWTYLFPAGTAYLWRETDRADGGHFNGIQACHHSSGIAGTTGNAEALMWQDIWVQPSTEYTASTNVWGVAGIDPANPTIGFGSAETDTAGLRIIELDVNRNVVLEHAKLEIKSATTSWAPLSKTFTTQATTRIIRFSCETKIACHWTMGRAVYDDNVLDGPAGSPPISNVTGTVTTGIAPDPVTPVEGATVTIGSATATTAADGTYNIPNLVTYSNVKVTVSKAGYYSENKYRDSIPEGANTVNFNLVASPASQLLRNEGWETNIYEYGENETAPHLSQYWWCMHMGLGTYIAYEKEGVRAPGFQHSGNDACTIATASDQPSGAYGTVIMYQDIPIYPEREYRAGVWVKGYGNFGRPNDKTGMWVQEIDKDGNLVVDHGLKAITTPTLDFELQYEKFTSAASTYKVRFMIYTQVACGWYLGRAIVDDAFLDGPALPTSVTGRVTKWMGNGQPAGPAVEGVTATVTNSSGTVLGTDTTDASGDYYVEIGDAAIGTTVTVRVASDLYFAERKNVTINRGPNTADWAMWLKGDLYPDFYNQVVNPSFEDTFNGNGAWKMEDAGFQNETWAATYNVPFYYQGAQAAETMPGSGGGTKHGMYQVVPVVGGESYSASVAFHGFGPSGFSVPENLNTGQYLYFYVNEYDRFGVLITAHDPVFAMSNGWEILAIPFTADPNTRTVRIGVRARIVDSSWTYLGRGVVDCFELNGPPAPGVPTINGLVKSAGVPVAGATVEIVGTDLITTTADDGYFELFPPINTNVWVRASKAGYFAQRFYRSTPGSALFDLTAVGTNLMSNPGFDDGRAANGWLQWSDGVQVFVYEADQPAPRNFQSGEEAGDVVKR